MTTAEIIIEQLGHRALYMLGAHTFTTNGGENLAFRIKGSRKVNYINIKYDALRDLYDMEFCKLARFDHKVIEQVNSVYADNMHSIIEEVTGLYTSI